MEALRHYFAQQAIDGPEASLKIVRAAEQLERTNWYLAGERYREAERLIHDKNDIKSRARILARAASCFELARQARTAARAYFDAASLLANHQTDYQVAGELFNRAALSFHSIHEYFNAGDSWRRAGEAFSKVSTSLIDTTDNIPPVPAAAGRFTVAGNCYTAAGDAFLNAGDNAKWACMAYWEAGRMHAQQGHGYHAYVAYRKALAAGAKLYGTHDRQEMRRYLPLTEAERTQKLDPVQVLEVEAARANRQHQSHNASVLSPQWADIATDRQMIVAFHDFYQAFLSIGNTREAGMYRAAEKERERKIAIRERRFFTAVLYWIWGKTAGYGENLARWSSVCLGSIVAFAPIYGLLDLIEPVETWFDYLYFSVVTFSSLGYGDIRPKGLLGKSVASIEILVGLVLFGVLLTFVSSRLQR